MFVAGMATMSTNTVTASPTATSTTSTTVNAQTSPNMGSSSIGLLITAIFSLSIFFGHTVHKADERAHAEAVIYPQSAPTNHFLSRLRSFFIKGQIATIAIYFFFRAVIIFANPLSTWVHPLTWIIVAVLSCIALSGLLFCLWLELSQSRARKAQSLLPL